MFRLDKVFQNDDNVYIHFVNFLKSVSILFSFYVFSILEENSIYELTKIEIYINSNFFISSIAISSLFFLKTIIFKKYSYYHKNLSSFLKDEFIFIISSFIFFYFFSIIFKINFILSLSFLYLFFLCLINLFFLKFFTNYLYNILIKKNVIQKNIMLVGKYHEIKKILNDKLSKIYVFKCCIVTDLSKQNFKLIKSEIKLPIFDEEDDIRSILEYHFLGQIWILNTSDIDKKNIIKKIFKYSVDTLNVKLDLIKNSKENTNLLANKYEYELYEKSKFYGASFFLKILIDKILSIIFLLLFSPIILISAIIIFIEDGFPVLFIQDRTGWDGRRFKIFKLRSLKKSKFDKTLEVQKNDKRLLKCGKFIRRWGIDEMPQFINVVLGDMSIVGPKAHMIEHDIYYAGIFNQFLKRYKCNPGITGWAQVNGLRGSTIIKEKMKKRMHYDLWYLNNWTIFLDIIILLKTVYALIKYEDE